MRDFWYDLCRNRFSPSGLEFGRELNSLNETLQTVRADQVQYQDKLDQLKSVIVEYMAGTTSAVQQAQTFEEIVGATGPTGPALYVPPGQKGFCPKCNRSTSDDTFGGTNCINCGTPLSFDPT